jgi:hypothetical protein
MNFTCILPSTNLSLMDWIIKHEVSLQICTPEEAICRAIDSTIEL